MIGRRFSKWCHRTRTTAPFYLAFRVETSAHSVSHCPQFVCLCSFSTRSKKGGSDGLSSWRRKGGGDGGGGGLGQVHKARWKKEREKEKKGGSAGKPVKTQTLQKNFLRNITKKTEKATFGRFHLRRYLPADHRNYAGSSRLSREKGKTKGSSDSF